MTAEQAEQKARANDTLAKVDFLLGNEHFRWFLKTVIEPQLEKEQKTALDAKKSSDERDRAVQRYDVVRQISKWLPEQRATLEMTIKSLDS